MLTLDIHTHGVEIKENLVSSDLIQAVIAEVEAVNESLPKHGIRIRLLHLMIKTKLTNY